MKFTFPLSVLLAAIPQPRFLVEDEADDHETLTKFFNDNFKEEVEVTPTLLARMVEVVEREFVVEMIYDTCKDNAELYVAFVAVMPMEMWENHSKDLLPTEVNRLFIGSIFEHAAFKLLWTYRDQDAYFIEQKLADVMASCSRIGECGYLEYAKQLKDEKLRNELCFLADPNEYVSHAPQVLLEPKYRATPNALEFVTAAKLESIGDIDWPHHLLESVIRFGRRALYYITPDTTPKVYDKVSSYLTAWFEGDDYTVKIGDCIAIRDGSRDMLLALLSLNSGAIIDTEEFDTLFGNIDTNLYLKAQDKLQRNSTSGAFGTGGEITDLLGDAEQRSGGSQYINYTINPTFTDTVPKLAEGVYVSMLNSRIEPLLNELGGKEVVELTPDELNDTKAKAVMVKYTNPGTLSELKDLRTLMHYAKRKLHPRVVFVPESWNIESLAALENVHLIYERRRDQSLTITSRYSPSFRNRRGNAGRGMYEHLALRAIAIRSEPKAEPRFQSRHC